MDASGVALVIIGPGSVDQVCPHLKLIVSLKISRAQATE